jgi:DNA-binding NtrC family response regulator
MKGGYKNRLMALVANYERDYLATAMLRHRYNITSLAKELDMTPMALSYHIRKHRLSPRQLPKKGAK